MSCFTRRRSLFAYGGYVTEIVWRRVILIAVLLIAAGLALLQ